MSGWADFSCEAFFYIGCAFVKAKGTIYFNVFLLLLPLQPETTVKTTFKHNFACTKAHPPNPARFLKISGRKTLIDEYIPVLRFNYCNNVPHLILK